MEKAHRHILRHLKKSQLPEFDKLDAKWQDFILRISRSYYENDQAHKMAARTNELSSEELLATNQELHAEAHKRQALETERAKMTQQLLAASREVGKSEVITGILHNVGNAFNSIGISCEAMLQSSKRSNLTNIGKISALLEKNSSNLINYLKADNHAVDIFEYLKQSYELLEKERHTEKEELTNLATHVSYIKKIISAQQGNAKSRNLTQDTDLTSLLDDSLLIFNSDLAKNNIQVDKHYNDNIPTIRTDGIKVQQIICNLIKNAMEAIKFQANTQQHILTLTTCFASHENTFLIKIKDTGQGIHNEHLTKIFNHGHTSKENGFGFGLHHSANSATELGGKLYANSPGIGLGSEFTLQLPLSSPSEISSNE